MRGLAVDDRLDAIAGRPAGMLVEAGTTGPLAGFTPTGAQSLYAVIDYAAEDTVYNTVAAIRTADTNYTFLQILTRPNEPNYQTQRRTRDDASDGLDISRTLLGALGRSAICVYAESNASTVFTALYGSDTIQSAAGKTDYAYRMPVELVLTSKSGVYTGLIAAAYPAVHTPYQRQAIMRKLLQISGG